MSQKKVKQPVTNGRAKVPVVMQMEALECGAASLAMVMAYYDKWVTAGLRGITRRIECQECPDRSTKLRIRGTGLSV